MKVQGEHWPETMRSFTQSSIVIGNFKPHNSLVYVILVIKAYVCKFLIMKLIIFY